MIYFRGCTAREKQTNISKATQSLLKKANIDYKILDNEMCCGSVLLRVGFIKEAKEIIDKNTKIFGDETILTSCAGCYKTLKQDYNGLNVIHISQFLDKLIKQNKLKITKKENINVTYHDSCHLARHMNVLDEPRNVIRSIANLVEMENNRENSLCCGAGGGVKSAYPEITKQMANLRIKQAKQTNTEIVITSCPFCKLNLANDDLKILDLCEFLVEYGDLNDG